MDNFFAVLGSDLALIKKEAANLVREVAGEHADEFTLDICETNDSVTADAAITAAINSIKTPAFMGMMKSVWLKNFPFEEEGGKGATDSLSQKISLLGEIIDAGLPSDINLIVSGSGSDLRKSFFKICKKHAQKLLVIDQPKISDKDWVQKVRSTIETYAKEKGLKLQHDALEHLINVFGVNTACIENELEKIVCYCGEGSISRSQILDICHGDREAEFYAYGSALCARDLNACFVALKRLFVNGKDESSVAIGILSQAANAMRQMLQMKLFMSICKVNAARVPDTLKNLSPLLRARLEKCSPDILVANPYAMKYKAIDAERYTGKEIVEAIHHLTDAYLKSVSTNSSRQLLLEYVALKIIKK
ncbi:MAG: DNA polymerase III subunit delta [Lentisphaeria bacterium]